MIRQRPLHENPLLYTLHIISHLLDSVPQGLGRLLRALQLPSRLRRPYFRGVRPRRRRLRFRFGSRDSGLHLLSIGSQSFRDGPRLLERGAGVREIRRVLVPLRAWPRRSVRVQPCGARHTMQSCTEGDDRRRGSRRRRGGVGRGLASDRMMPTTRAYSRRDSSCMSRSLARSARRSSFAAFSARRWAERRADSSTCWQAVTEDKKKRWLR